LRFTAEGAQRKTTLKPLRILRALCASAVNALHSRLKYKDSDLIFAK
jgi:hypothetical protein